MNAAGMKGNLAAAGLLPKGLAWGWRLLPARLFHPGFTSNLLVSRSVVDSLWWDPGAAGKQFAFWSVVQSMHRLDYMAATQLPWRTSLWTSLAGGGSLYCAPTPRAGQWPGRVSLALPVVTPAALPLLCRFPSSAPRRAYGQRSSNCVRAYGAPACHPRS